MQLLYRRNVEILRGLETSSFQGASVVIGALSGRWTVPILLAMRGGPVRLSDLCRYIPEASKKMIIESVRRLERRGIVDRHDFSGKLLHVEYRIHDAIKQQTIEVLNQLAEYSKHLVATGNPSETG